jgi:ABC-type oligopeptide transport system substrate-binding subunit
MRSAILLFGATASFIAAAALLSPAVAEDKAKSISEITVTKPVDASSPKLYPNNTKPGSSINSAPTRDKVESKGENIRRVK